MKGHLENLQSHIPDILEGKILDLGSGKGNFLIDISLNGGQAYGVEPFQEYVNFSLEKAREKNISIYVKQGIGESIPFEDEYFDFVNMSEVIEHVVDPKKVMEEVRRVLKPGGGVYVSVPSRFSWFDTHFHLPFINWMPRSWAHKVIGLLGKHKDYSKGNGRQRIDEMYYATFNQVRKFFEEFNFIVVDIREKKIKEKSKFLGGFAVVLYKLLRFFSFKTHHMILKK